MNNVLLVLVLVLGSFVGLAAFMALTAFGADRITVSVVLALTLASVISSSLIGIVLKPDDL